MEYSPLTRTLEPQDYLDRGDIGVLGNLKLQIPGGFEESFGAGTAYRDLTTPGLAKVPVAGGRGGAISRQETPEEVAKRGDHLFTDPLELKKEFPDVPFEAGMTRSRGAAIQEGINDKKVRDYWAQKRPISAFFGQAIGNAVDPINYIPIFGEASAGASLVRIAGKSALEAATNTAIFGGLTASERARYGDDVGWGATAQNIALSALAGFTFGLGGKAISLAFSKDRPSIPHTPENTMKAAVVANQLTDSLLQHDELRIDENSQAILNEFINAYHGSAAEFDKFRSEFIGTGEGAQSFGHGFYFAEERKVAEDYQTTYAKPESNMARRTLDQFNGDREKAIAALQEDLKVHTGTLAETTQKAVDILQSGKDPSSLYQVRINSPRERFVNQDIPMAQQTAYVKERLKEAAKNLSKPGPLADQLKKTAYRILQKAMRGEGEPQLATNFLKSLDLYMESPAKASDFLRQHGIVGSEFFDKVSRQAGEGTKNFVVFDPNLIDIVARNDRPVNGRYAQPPEPPKEPALAEAEKRAVQLPPNDLVQEITKVAKTEGLDIETGKTDLDETIQQMIAQNELTPDNPELKAADDEWLISQIWDKAANIALRCPGDG